MIEFDGRSLTVEKVFAISERQGECRLSREPLAELGRSRKRFEALADQNTPIYGVTTGFGEMVYVRVHNRHETELQMNLIRSHCAGVGPVFSRSQARAILAARLNALMRGYSAVRTELVERLFFYLDHDILPAIPQVGSLGASGDLAPLSHLAVALAGEGFVLGPGDQPVPTRQALEPYALPPIELKYKEGLALINGTSAMTGVGSLVAHHGHRQIQQAEIISAFALEVLKASDSPYQPNGHELARPHPGQVDCAWNIRTLLRGSGLIETHQDLQEQITRSDGEAEGTRSTGIYLQKAYTLRCIPQILGAVRNVFYHVRETLTTELNSSNDNPLFFDNGEVFHGGNFHGQPIAFAMDYLAIGLAQLGVTSERRTNRLLNRHLSGMTEFLVAGQPGLSCGFMGAQYPATALVAENRVICNPASIQSVPSNGDNQDVVSMGLISARNARRILDNNQYILAVELLCVAQAADHSRRVEALSPAARAIYGLVREHVPTLQADRYMTTDLEAVAALLADGRLLERMPQAGVVLR